MSRPERMMKVIKYKREVCLDFIHGYFKTIDEYFIPERKVCFNLEGNASSMGMADPIRVSVFRSDKMRAEPSVTFKRNADLSPRTAALFDEDDPSRKAVDPQAQEMQIPDRLAAQIMKLIEAEELNKTLGAELKRIGC